MKGVPCLWPLRVIDYPRVADNNSPALKNQRIKLIDRAIYFHPRCLVKILHIHNSLKHKSLF